MNADETERRLRSRTFAVRHGDDLVFLDVERDGYFVLVNAGAWIDLDPLTGRIAVSDADASRDLEEAGLMGPVELGGRTSRSLLPRPARDLPRTAPVRPRPGDVLEMGWVALEMIWLFWLRPLASMVKADGISSDGDAPAASEALIRRTLIFERLLPWTPFQGECLFRAAMLRRFLQRAGHETSWVFGVRTWPFAAHCWLQVGEMVINDRVESVATYSPIMVA